MSGKIYNQEDLERVQKTYTKIINQYKIALADAIVSENGVMPVSAMPLISSVEIEMARTRKHLFNKESEEKLEITGNSNYVNKSHHFGG